jgi:hypothetical protein
MECYRPHLNADWHLDEVRGTDQRVAVAFSWAKPDGSRTRRAQLLTLRNGRIVRIRDFANPRRAFGAAGT